MLSVGIKELKSKLSNYVDQVRHGEEIVITDHGKEVAMVIPISKERRAIKALSIDGKARWAGAKPVGMEGLKIKGEPISKTVLEERR